MIIFSSRAVRRHRHFLRMRYINKVVIIIIIMTALM